MDYARVPSQKISYPSMFLLKYFYIVYNILLDVVNFYIKIKFFYVTLNDSDITQSCQLAIHPTLVGQPSINNLS